MKLFITQPAIPCFEQVRITPKARRSLAQTIAVDSLRFNSIEIACAALSPELSVSDGTKSSVNLIS
jgi:hypothetical protein